MLLLFLCEIMCDERLQKFHTDYMSLLRKWYNYNKYCTNSSLWTQIYFRWSLLSNWKVREVATWEKSAFTGYTNPCKPTFLLTTSNLLLFPFYFLFICSSVHCLITLQLLNSMVEKLRNFDDNPLPQDLQEGVDDDEWVCKKLLLNF